MNRYGLTISWSGEIEKPIYSREVPRVKSSSADSSFDVGRARREQIIRATREIIANDGLEHVTIARIATEADVSRGVVTYHFDSKEEILHEALRAAMNDANRAASALDLSDGGEIAELIDRVTRLTTTRESDWWPIYFAFLGQALGNPFYREELANVDASYRSALTDVVGDEAKAVVLLSVMKGLAQQAFVNHEMSLVAASNEMRSLFERWAAS